MDIYLKGECDREKCGRGSGLKKTTFLPDLTLHRTCLIKNKSVYRAKNVDLRRSFYCL